MTFSVWSYTGLNLVWWWAESVCIYPGTYEAVSAICALWIPFLKFVGGGPGTNWSFNGSCLWAKS